MPGAPINLTVLKYKIILESNSQLNLSGVHSLPKTLMTLELFPHVVMCSMFKQCVGWQSLPFTMKITGKVQLEVIWIVQDIQEAAPFVELGDAARVEWQGILKLHEHEHSQSNPTCQKNKTSNIMGQALLHYLKLTQTEQFSLYSMDSPGNL